MGTDCTTARKRASLARSCIDSCAAAMTSHTSSYPMATTTRNTLGMITVGACTTPVMISAAIPAAKPMQTTRLPPTTSARRRANASPLRHTVTAALMTRMISSAFDSWGTTVHGFGTPTGAATHSPPQTTKRSSPVTSRKLTLTPVVKLSTRASRRVAHVASASSRVARAEIEIDEPDHRQHERAQRHVRPAQRRGVCLRSDRLHEQKLAPAEHGGGYGEKGEHRWL